MLNRRGLLGGLLGSLFAPKLPTTTVTVPHFTELKIGEAIRPFVVEMTVKNMEPIIQSVLSRTSVVLPDGTKRYWTIEEENYDTDTLCGGTG